jgi:glycosyltransferase involved in cell wall biosynthesis
MALKVPVLARKIPGNESVITDFETGLLFSNEDEFIEKLQRLLTSADIRSHVIQKAKEAVNAHHSLEKEIAAYLAIYEGLGQKCQSIR